MKASSCRSGTFSFNYLFSVFSLYSKVFGGQAGKEILLLMTSVLKIAVAEVRLSVFYCFKMLLFDKK